MGCKGLKLMVVCNVYRGERVPFHKYHYSNVCDLAIDEPTQNILLIEENFLLDHNRGVFKKKHRVFESTFRRMKREITREIMERQSALQTIASYSAILRRLSIGKRNV